LTGVKDSPGSIKFSMNGIRLSSHFGKSDPVFKNTSKNDLRIPHYEDDGFILHRKSEDQQNHLALFIQSFPQENDI
jgi:hypothetical protein